MKLLENEPVAPKENEKSALKRLGGFFFPRSFESEKRGTPKLVGPDGYEIELPDSVFQALCQVVYHMMQGRAVSIIPINKEVTTQEAADFLNVSRPFLVRLLEQGEIPFIKVGTHRRVRFSDLVTYKQRRDTERRRGLAEIAHISEDEGLYD